MNVVAVKRHVFWALTISLTIYLCMLMLANSTFKTFKQYAGNDLNAIELTLKKNGGQLERVFKFGDIGQLKAEYPNNVLFYYSEVERKISRGNQTLQIKSVLTDTNFAVFTKMHFVKGSFFTEDACEEGRNVAIISRGLAERLFHAYHVIGNTMDISGQLYSVVGVYEKRNSILSLLGSDAVERVYVPYRSVQKANDLPVDTIVIHQSSESNASFRHYKTIRHLEKNFGMDASCYKVIDYYSMSFLLGQNQKVLVFFLGM